jgi:hypothetical protein
MLKPSKALVIFWQQCNKIYDIKCKCISTIAIKWWTDLNYLSPILTGKDLKMPNDTPCWLNFF